MWLTKDEIALLFEKDITVISKHINNIYKEGELEEQTICAKNAQVQLEGKRKIVRTHKIYNLDVIIPLGYKVHSQNGNYVINENRTLITNENYVNLLYIFAFS